MARKKAKPTKQEVLSPKANPISSQRKPKLPKNALWAILAALALTFVCFSQTLDYGFVAWDDDRNIYENEHIKTLQAENFWVNSKKIWTSTVIGNYNPLSIWTFAVEKVTYGMDQLGYWHLTNVLLHLLCVWLVFRIALLLGLSWRGAVFVALLFGIHPMRVESVAWLTERKDVLYGAFYLAALLLYIKGKQTGKSYWVWIILLFVLSLFSKIQAVVLPLSMILVDYYISGKLTWKSIVQKAPLLLISLGFGLAGIYFLSEQGSIDTNSNTYTSVQRIFVGTYSYVVYLVKAVVPYRLSPLYPYESSMPAYYYPSILALPAVLLLLWRAYEKEWRAVFFGLGFFSVNIFFLLQILGAGQGFLADRFTYIAYFGLFFMAGYGVDFLAKKYAAKAAILWASLAIIIAAYSALTYNQVGVWENSETLWTHVLRYYKNTTLPYGNRANYLRDQGRYTEALEDYSQSIRLNPNGHQAYNSRARLYFTMATTRDTLLLALQDYTKAIELSPNDGEFYVNRGATYARLGQGEQAIADLDKGLAIKPDHAVGYLNRSVIHNGMGNIPKALADIDSYLELRPYDANMWYEKGRASRQMGQAQAALAAYSRAIELNSGNGLFWHERARSKQQMGDMPGAKADMGRAIGLGYQGIDATLRQQLGL